MEENISTYWWSLRSNFLLAIVRARERPFSNAQGLITQVIDELDQDATNLFKESCSSVEFELALAVGRWKYLPRLARRAISRCLKNGSGSCESIFIPNTPYGFMIWLCILLRNTGSEPTGGFTIEYLIY